MIREVFEDGGLLSAALRRSGRSPKMRAAQRDYAVFVDEGIRAATPVFADAETGVGKTLGYLVPVLLRAFEKKDVRPIVVVSTATIALQRQLLSDDVPLALDVVKQALGLSLKAEFRVGREQIVDIDRMSAAVADMVASEDRSLAEEMIAWVRDKIARSELPLRADLAEAFAGRVDGPRPWLSASAIGLNDDEGDSGRLYGELIERCEQADVLVVNHHLLTLNMFRPFLWDVERAVHLVVDEADRLPWIVEEIDRLAVPLHALQRTVASTPDSEPAVEAISQLAAVAMSHLGNAWTNSVGGVTQVASLDREERRKIHEAVRTAHEAVGGLKARLSLKPSYFSGSDRETFSDIARAHYELVAIEKELDVGRANALLYFSPVRHFPGIASVNPGSGRAIARRLWNDSPFEMRSLVFTSATLGTMASSSLDADFKRALTPFIGDCGFKIVDIPASACIVIAPNRFGTMTFVRPPLGISKPFDAPGEAEVDAKLNPDVVGIWAQMVEAAADQGGRTLVLVPSHRDIKALTPYLTRFNGKLISQTDGMPTTAAVARFTETEGSVWVSAAAWEGVSLPGVISHIVIPRIPIRPATLEDNLIESYFQEQGSESRGKSIVFARRMAEARRRLRQGIGRGIRSQDDAVKVWLGDSRWPLTQDELDEGFLDQPTSWSSTMLNAIPKRFRKALERSPRFSIGRNFDDRLTS